jgi:hypothetical protein
MLPVRGGRWCWGRAGNELEGRLHRGQRTILPVAQGTLRTGCSAGTAWLTCALPHSRGCRTQRPMLRSCSCPPDISQLSVRWPGCPRRMTRRPPSGDAGRRRSDTRPRAALALVLPNVVLHGQPPFRFLFLRTTRLAPAPRRFALRRPGPLPLRPDSFSAAALFRLRPRPAGPGGSRPRVPAERGAVHAEGSGGGWTVSQLGSRMPCSSFATVSLCSPARSRPVVASARQPRAVPSAARRSAMTCSCPPRLTHSDDGTRYKYTSCHMSTRRARGAGGTIRKNITTGIERRVCQQVYIPADAGGRSEPPRDAREQDRDDDPRRPGRP